MTLPVILLFPLWLFPSIFSRIVFSSPFPFLPFCFILLDDSLLYYITSHPSNNITPIFWNLTSHHLLTDYIQFQVTENCSNGLKQQGDFIDSFNWKAEKLGRALDMDREKDSWRRQDSSPISRQLSWLCSPVCVDWILLTVPILASSCYMS